MPTQTQPPTHQPSHPFTRNCSLYYKKQNLASQDCSLIHKTSSNSDETNFDETNIDETNFDEINFDEINFDEVNFDKIIFDEVNFDEIIFVSA